MNSFFPQVTIKSSYTQLTLQLIDKVDNCKDKQETNQKDEKEKLRNISEQALYTSPLAHLEVLDK